MRFRRFLRIFSAACVLGLLAAAIPAVPAMATALVYLYPSSGPPGTTITVYGTGFTGATASVTSTGLGSATATLSSGYLMASLIVPTNTAPGPYTIYMTDTAANTASATFTVTSGFTLSPTTGFVGDTVTVSGTGFTAYASIPFYWDSSSTAFTSLTATSYGTLLGTITIPPAARGSHTISSVTGTTPQSFIVGSKIAISPTSGGVGDTVTVTGSGFGAGPTNSVAISVDGVNVAATTPSVINTNVNGGFSCTFVMPSVARGSHTVMAADSGGNATAPFSVGQKISLTPVTGGAGDNIIINGNGFSASEIISFKLDGVALTVSPASVTSDSSGAFSNVSFIIPSLTAGSHTVSASDTDGNVANATLATVAKISITPSSGTVGTQITLNGSGFAPSAPVSIFWDAGATPVTTTTTSASGTLSGFTFNAQVGAKGTHTIKVQDTSGNQASATFTVTPKIALSPATGGFNDSITITFSGFAASSTVTLSIVSGSNTYSVTTNPSPLVTDANGGASATFVVPGVYNGNWTIQATDSSSNSAQATLAVKQKLAIDTTTGAAGTQVQLTGTGFIPSKGISITYSGKPATTNPTSVSSDANGSFVILLTVPAAPAGSYNIGSSDGINTATVSFAEIASASISTVTSSSAEGFVGQSLTIHGSGFLADTTITISYASTPVTLKTVTSDDSGGFIATFTIPASPAGQHTITASDGTTTKTFTFFMDSTPPAAPSLLLPATSSKPKQPIAFSWSAVTDPSGVTYTLEISQDPNFATVVVPNVTGLTTTSYTMITAEKLKSAGSKTPYYWRVQAIDLAGNVGAWSTANTFTIGFIWPWWMIHVWYGLGIIVALILGLWLGRRMAYQSY